MSWISRLLAALGVARSEGKTTGASLPSAEEEDPEALPPVVEIEIGPMSGLSNVTFYLKSRGIPDDDSLAKEVLEEAKKSDSTLSEERIMAIVESHQQASKA